MQINLIAWPLLSADEQEGSMRYCKASDELPAELIEEIQKYIDNIIKCNFVLTQSEWQSEFVDCGCQNTSEQEKSIEILKRFSVALGYIKNDQIIGHKNYINDALYDWASLLYEKMYW